MKIYVVICCYGRYEDYTEEILKSFKSKDKASEFVQELENNQKSDSPLFRYDSKFEIEEVEYVE